MNNYEIVHHFFSKDDRKIMGKVNDLIIVDKNKGMWFYITYDGCPMIGEYIATNPDEDINWPKVGGYCEWEEIGDMSVAEIYELNLLFVRLYGYVIDDLLCQHERRGTLTTSRRKYKHEADFACHKREE
jgi:hypothetical protein